MSFIVPTTTGSATHNVGGGPITVVLSLSLSLSFMFLHSRLIDECGVSMYCDMHAHSRRHNIFIYGCENKRNPEKKLTEQVFPLMLHKNVADKVSLYCDRDGIHRYALRGNFR